MKQATGDAAVLRDPKLASVIRLSAVDTVRARIGLALELNLLQPGERLPSDAEVAQALEVSEITARRALMGLAQDGFLNRIRGKNGGTFVSNALPKTKISETEAYKSQKKLVDQLIDERTLAECSLGYFAVKNATQEQFDYLDAQIQAAAQADNWADYHRADELFHKGLALASGQSWGIMRHAEVLAELYKFFVPYPIDYLHEVNHDHELILKHLKNRDAEAAVAQIRDHIQVLHKTMFTGLPTA